MNELDLYISQWNQLNRKTTETDQLFLERLTSHGHHGNLHTTRFRSVYWKFYLGCLSSKRANWEEETRIYRELYTSLKKQYLPVTDLQLKQNIEQDVRRTMPDMEFFRSTSIQSQMTDILTLWSIASPCGKRLSYRQGVHELLAPILFVLHCDQESLTGYLQNFTKKLPQELKTILDPKFIEHDSFLMLCRLLYYIEPWYGTNQLFKQLKQPQSPDKTDEEIPLDEVPNSTAALLDGRMSRTEEEFQTEHIDVKLLRIHEKLLPEIDPELAAHLRKEDIIPQVYGIRWLRLLFGREFALQDFLIIWDAIFSDCLRDHSMGKLTDFVFCSMLIEIRNDLLNGDDQECVQKLMKYPVVEDVTRIVSRAKELCVYHEKNKGKITQKNIGQNMEKAVSAAVGEITKINWKGWGDKLKNSVSNITVQNPGSVQLGQFNPQHPKISSNSSNFRNFNQKPRAINSSQYLPQNQSKMSKAFSGLSLNTYNRSSPATTPNLLSPIGTNFCAEQLEKIASQLQEVIQSDSMMEDANKLNFERLCVVLANVKQTKDVLNGNISPSSIDQL